PHEVYQPLIQHAAELPQKGGTITEPDEMMETESDKFVTVVAVEAAEEYVTVLSVGGGDQDGEDVLVYRLPGERLGFGLKFEGGTATGERVRRLFIQSCAPDSPASRVTCSWGSLQEGDEVLQIDSVPVNMMTRLDCVRCLKDSNVVLKLHVRHAPPPPVPPRRSKERPPEPEVYLDLLAQEAAACLTESESDEPDAPLSYGDERVLPPKPAPRKDVFKSGKKRPPPPPPPRTDRPQCPLNKDKSPYQKLKIVLSDKKMEKNESENVTVETDVFVLVDLKTEDIESKQSFTDHSLNISHKSPDSKIPIKQTKLIIEDNEMEKNDNFPDLIECTHISVENIVEKTCCTNFKVNETKTNNEENGNTNLNINQNINEDKFNSNISKEEKNVKAGCKEINAQKSENNDTKSVVEENKNNNLDISECKDKISRVLEKQEGRFLSIAEKKEVTSKIPVLVQERDKLKPAVLGDKEKVSNVIENKENGVSATENEENRPIIVFGALSESNGNIPIIVGSVEIKSKMIENDDSKSLIEIKAAGDKRSDENSAIVVGYKEVVSSIDRDNKSLVSESKQLKSNKMDNDDRPMVTGSKVNASDNSKSLVLNNIDMKSKITENGDDREIRSKIVGNEPVTIRRKEIKPLIEETEGNREPKCKIPILGNEK
ncbi:hypothetical protein L9F63_017505, partial [Diploptera punctata]